MRRARGRVRPGRLGLGWDYAKLWSATAVSTLGDGITLAAGPLLLASLTSDPFLIGGAVFAQQAPWLLFSLFSGAFVDRVNRLRLVGLVDILRGVVMGCLAILVWLEWATVPIAYVAVFLLGIGATLADNASQTLVPTVVPAADLSRANAWLSGARMVTLQFAGPPLGSLLFVTAIAAPFGLDAASFIIAAALVLAIHRDSQRSNVEHVTPTVPTTMTRQIAEGVRWLWHHPGLRTLAVTMGIMNITYGGAFAVFILYARQRLDISEGGFGFLLAATAVGGVAATFLVSRLEARFGPATLLRIGMIIETLTYLVLGWTTIPWVAGAILVVFGGHAIIWSVIGVTLRQRITPTELLGRVTSANYLLTAGGFAIGSLAGGAVARYFGITAPFWLAFAVMVPLTAIVWRALRPVAFAVPEHPPVSQRTVVQPQT